MLLSRALPAALFAGVLLLSSPARSADETPAPETRLAVGGEVPKPLSLSAADLAALPRQRVTARDHEGREATYEGVALVELLRRTGLELGEKLRGKKLALFLVAEASDGYRAVYALPELDPTFTDRVILLADLKDGKPFSAKEGPLRIVVPGEKMQARWVRQVVALVVRGI